MSKSGSLYVERNSLFHRLDGSVKLLMLIGWTFFVFAFMDVRVFVAILLVGLSLLWLSKLPAKVIAPLFAFIIIFTIFNSIFLLIVTPLHGSKLTGTFTELINIGGKYIITFETLFYCIALSLKYISIMPITILFLFTTHPSNFAGSLNRLGISYRVSYAVNLALRYIPDIKAEVDTIVNAQEARGVAFRKGDANVFIRLKNYGTVLVPLVFSSLQRIDVISNAMDLRGFGKNKTRTWYHRRPLNSTDFIFIVLALVLLIGGIAIKATVGAVFWYPFS